MRKMLAITLMLGVLAVIPISNAHADLVTTYFYGKGNFLSQYAWSYHDYYNNGYYYVLSNSNTDAIFNGSFTYDTNNNKSSVGISIYNNTNKLLKSDTIYNVSTSLRNPFYLDSKSGSDWTLNPFSTGQ